MKYVSDVAVASKMVGGDKAGREREIILVRSPISSPIALADGPPSLPLLVQCT